MKCADDWQVVCRGADGDYREVGADDSGVGALIEEPRAQPFGSQVVSMSAFDALNGEREIPGGQPSVRKLPERDQ
jgi:hypothetical protein